MILRIIGVGLVVFAAVLAVSYWLHLPMSLAVLGGALFAVLAAWDDAWYCSGKWRDEYWDGDD